MRRTSPCTRIIGGRPADRCRSEALFLTTKASSSVMSMGFPAGKRACAMIYLPIDFSGHYDNNPANLQAVRAYRRGAAESGGSGEPGNCCWRSARPWPRRVREAVAGRTARLRRELRAGRPGKDRCAAGLGSNGISSAPCRATRPGRWPSISPGCTASTAEDRRAPVGGAPAASLPPLKVCICRSMSAARPARAASARRAPSWRAPSRRCQTCGCAA
jgi:hypothetical protein